MNTEALSRAHAARRPVPMYLYEAGKRQPLDAEGLAWLADQLCSDERVHPERTMSVGWITSQAAYEYPALIDRIEEMEAALRKIASCEKRTDGDVVDIARAALGEQS